MTQYLALLFNELIITLGDAIDSGFANSISLGVICVFAIIGSLKYIPAAFYQYGAYYYRVYNCKAKAGLVISIVMSVSVSVLFICLADYIKYVYYIEPKYEKLLRNCMIVGFAYFPFVGISQYLGDVLIYSSKEKCVSKSNIVFYSILIPLDVIAALVYHSPELVLAGTGLAYFVKTIILYNNADFRKDKCTLDDIKTILIVGFPLFLNSVLCRVCTVLINIIGSKLGTEYYAILSISRKSLEGVQLCLWPIVAVMVTKMRDWVDVTYGKVLKYFKSVISVAVTAYIVVGIVVFIVCGAEIRTVEVFGFCVLVNILSLFCYTEYAINQSIIIVCKYNDIMGKMGILRFLITILLCIVSYWYIDSLVGLWILALYSFIADSIVSAYQLIKIKHRMN